MYLQAPPPTVSGANQDLSSDEHTARTTFTGPYSAMNHANFGPPARYTSEMGYDDPPLQVAVSYHSVVYLNTPVIDNLFSEGPCRTGHVSWNPN